MDGVKRYRGERCYGSKDGRVGISITGKLENYCIYMIAYCPTLRKFVFVDRLSRQSAARYLKALWRSGNWDGKIDVGN